MARIWLRIVLLGSNFAATLAPTGLHAQAIGKWVMSGFRSPAAPRRNSNSRALSLCCTSSCTRRLSKRVGDVAKAKFYREKLVQRVAADGDRLGILSAKRFLTDN